MLLIGPNKTGGKNAVVQPKHRTTRLKQRRTRTNVHRRTSGGGLKIREVISRLNFEISSTNLDKRQNLTLKNSNLLESGDIILLGSRRSRFLRKEKKNIPQRSA